MLFIRFLKPPNANDEQHSKLHGLRVGFDRVFLQMAKTLCAFIKNVTDQALL